MVLSLGKIAVIGGAGLLWSVVASEGHTVNDFLSGAFKVFKHINRDDSSKSTSRPKNDHLMDQLNSVRRELQMLSSSNGTVTIVNSGKSGASSYGASVLVIIVVGYGVIWWKGWKISDLMFASKRNLKDACSTVGKELDTVSLSVSDTKQFLSTRIDRVDINLDECLDFTVATRNEVTCIKGEVEEFGSEVVDIRSVFQKMEEKIITIGKKQTLTTAGIDILVKVAEQLDQSDNRPFIPGPSSSSSRPALEQPHPASTSRTGSWPPKLISSEPASPSSAKFSRISQGSFSATGLKDIQEITESLKIITDSETPRPNTADIRSEESLSSGIFSRWKLPSLSRTRSATVTSNK